MKVSIKTDAINARAFCEILEKQGVNVELKFFTASVGGGSIHDHSRYTPSKAVAEITVSHEENKLKAEIDWLSKQKCCICGSSNCVIGDDMDNAYCDECDNNME